MDCVMIALFGASVIISFVRDEYWVMLFFLLLALAWLIILMKDREIGHYVKLIEFYKEVMKENDEFLDKLVNSINEKQQTDNDTDTRK